MLNVLFLFSSFFYSFFYSWRGGWGWTGGCGWGLVWGWFIGWFWGWFIGWFWGWLGWLGLVPKKLSKFGLFWFGPWFPPNGCFDGVLLAGFGLLGTLFWGEPFCCPKKLSKSTFPPLWGFCLGLFWFEGWFDCWFEVGGLCCWGLGALLGLEGCWFCEGWDGGCCLGSGFGGSGFLSEGLWLDCLIWDCEISLKCYFYLFSYSYLICSGVFIPNFSY